MHHRVCTIPDHDLLVRRIREVRESVNRLAVELAASRREVARLRAALKEASSAGA